MAQKKKTSAKRKKPQPKKGDYRQILAVILFFFNLLLAVFAAVPGESVWLSVHNFLLGLGGFWIFPWLAFFGYLWAILSFQIEKSSQKPRLWGVAVSMFLIGTTIQLFYYSADFAGYGDFISFAYDKGISGGGVIGALLAYPFGSWFGKVGGIVIAIFIVLVLVLLMTGTTLKQVLTGVSKPVKKISEDTAVAIQQHKERKKEKEWDISLDGMPDEPIDPPKKDTSNLDDKGRRLVETYNNPEADVPVETEKPPVETEEPPVEEETDVDDSVNLDEIIRQFNDEPEHEGTEKPEPIGEVPATTKENENGQQEFSEIQVADDQPPEYRYPPISLLKAGAGASGGNIQEELKNNAELLVDTLRSFGVETRIINISRGPSITRYELQPAAGVKISRITNLADDIALNLATAGVRIEAPIPNKAAVGIEVPNKNTSSVCLRDIVDSETFESAKSKLTAAVGKDVTGNIITGDLAKMPHLLIAGTTGSGKSVCISSFIVSILYKSSPEDVKLLMIDPKVVEFEVYNGLPHLLVPVVSDPKKASGALGWAVTEMEKRYKIFGECHVRNLADYNKFAETHEGFEHMPQILIVVDELADLMMVAPSEVEDSICRLAQKARAAGMHLVVATQRPSADVITGLIKANIPSRVALKVANATESRIILDTAGAEKLLGRGDMLFYPVGTPKPVRVQGCWVSDDEIKDVVNYIIGDTTNEYSQEISEEIERHAAESKGGKKGGASAGEDSDGGDGDEMLPQAIEVVVEAGIASTSLLQRKLKLGYARAARIVDQMEQRGIVGPFEGSKPRKVLITKQQYEEMRMNTSE